MATRTFKFYGKAFTTGTPVTVTLGLNNQTVFTGDVTATTQTTPIGNNETVAELFTFTADTSVYGEIPLSLAVTGGDLFWSRITANYSGDVYEVDQSLLQDRDAILSMPPGPVFTDNTQRTFVMASVDNFANVDYFVTDGDGRENVQVNGVTVPDRTPQDPALVGRWQYLIPAGSTLTCVQKISPPRQVE